MKSTEREIKRLKTEKNAVILAHNYQVAEVHAVADILGDSLDLSRHAAAVEHETIVFAGVKFMAETAKILSPRKTVLLPRLDAGCPMADMITVEDLRQLKSEHPRAAVVTYVNSTAEIKAESDVCCTSANAINVVRHVEAEEVIFIPDRNLGQWIQSRVPEKKIWLFEGYCYVHNRIKPEEIQEMKDRFPDAPVIVHPETPMAVIELADEVLSTSQMLAYVARKDADRFVVGTEQGLLERMKRENPGKEFYPALRPKICSNMKRTSLRDVLDALKYNRYEIHVPQKIAKGALRALEKMLQYT